MSPSNYLEANEFHVYLSYRHTDARAALEIFDFLTRRNLKVWIDKQYLQNAADWQVVAQEGMLHSLVALVVVGREGLGEGQTLELKLLREIPGLKIIPVLLPGAPGGSLALLGMSESLHVDFSQGLGDAVARDALINLVYKYIDIGYNLAEGLRLELQRQYGSMKLRIREAPSAQAYVRGFVAVGMVLEVLEPSAVAYKKLGNYNEWIRIRTSTGIEGYVEARYVSVAPPETPPTAAQPEGERPKSGAGLPPEDSPPRPESARARDEFDAHISLLIPRKKADEAQRPQKRRPGAPNPRTLNLNFATAQAGRVLALNEPLLAGAQYDLLVDIGPHRAAWPTLIKTGAEFPEDARTPYLRQQDREAGWFDVEVAFFSQEFSPRMAHGRMRVPVAPTQRATPYTEDGFLAPAPGLLRLHLTAPATRQAHRAHGRLCVYYGAQVLQSVIVNAAVSPTLPAEPQTPNFARVDYMLDTDLGQVGDLMQRYRAHPGGAAEPAPVRIGLMVNDDLSGTHRILLKEQSLPPAWKTYSEESIADDLQEARRILGGVPLRAVEYDHDGAGLKKFKADLTALAVLGARLYSELLMGVTPAENIPTMIWRQKFRNALQPGNIIQLARAGSVPATHTIPWALLYDYPLEAGRSDQHLQLCRVIDEQWDAEVRRRVAFQEQAGLVCPYEHEHTSNTICPFGFWGYKYTLEQPISALFNKDWDVPPARRVLVGDPVKMAVAATTDVPRESRRQQHFQFIHTAVNAEYIPKNPAAERDQVRDSLRAPQLVYILCHGGKNGKTTYLSIGPRDQDALHTITPELPGAWGEHNYIDAEKWVETRPLVFINGCSTTELLPELTLEFVSAFRDLYAGGVIGTEIQVTVEHGYRAAEKFFERLGRGEDVGQAILGMRWDLLNEGSLLGLAYTPYAMADLHLEREC
jgi:hypothetical protein